MQTGKPSCPEKNTNSSNKHTPYTTYIKFYLFKNIFAIGRQPCAYWSKSCSHSFLKCKHWQTLLRIQSFPAYPQPNYAIVSSKYNCVPLHYSLFSIKRIIWLRIKALAHYMQLIMTGLLCWHNKAVCFGSEMRAATHQLQTQILKTSPTVNQIQLDFIFPIFLHQVPFHKVYAFNSSSQAVPI